MQVSYEVLGDGIEVAVSQNHRFGTDAFLLADFAAPRRKDKMLDLGCGCGIIPLLSRYRFGAKEIHGMDIQQEAIDLFNLGLEKSNQQNMFAHCLDLKAIRSLLPDQDFDLVTCNPPYKKVGAGILSDNSPEAIARHEIHCTLQDVCNAAAAVLKFGGRLCICQRPERLMDALFAMRAAKIEPRRLRFISRRPDTAPWLFLLEGKKGGKEFLQIEPQFYVQDEKGDFSSDLMKVYQKEQNNG